MNTTKDNIKDIIAEKAIEYYSCFASMHSDLTHTQEVVTYTRLIAVGEGLDESEVSMLEAAAWLHDIGCPRSKVIFGDTLPINQQRVGRDVTSQLLQDEPRVSQEQREWLMDVVGSHHQLKSSSDLNFKALFEADLIVNLLSGYHPREKAEMLFDTMMSTDSGKRLFKTLIK